MLPSASHDPVPRMPSSTMIRTEPASRVIDAPALHRGAPFVAADVGGTHARVALVRRDRDGVIEILDHRQYACADYPSLGPIVADFLAASDRPQVHDAVIGCAGVRRGDLVVGTNLAWPVSLSELRALGIDRVVVVNDFVAVAHAVQCMRDGGSLLPGDRAGPPPPGPTLVVGPGTGLGAAVRVPHGDGAVVLPCEAGQIAFAPGNAREIAVLAKMLEAAPYVSSEQVVSGPGLFKLYSALCVIDGVDARQDAPSAVVGAARRGDDAHAVEAVQVFCEAFGSLLGDLVIASAATSVYIAGGIVPRIRDLLDASAFHARFVNKGLMRPMLEQVPVRLIDDPHNGVIGAAAWYLAQPGTD